MVDKKISELDPAGPLTGAEELAIVQGAGPDTVKTTVQKVIEAGKAFKGAMVERTSAQTIPDNAYTGIAWTTEAYDIGEFWSAGLPGKFTIPTGVTKIRASCGIEWQNNSLGRRDLSIFKNNSSNSLGLAGVTVPAKDSTFMTISTGVVSVVSGDAISASVFQNSGGSLDVCTDLYRSSWFQIEVVEEVNSSLLTGSASLGNLSDVDLVPAPTDKQALVFNATTSKWEPKPVVQADVVNTFTKAQSVAFVTLIDGANIPVDASLSNNFKVTLAGDRTLDNPTNLADGQVLNFRIKQDGTPPRTLAYGSKYTFPGGTDPVLSTGANDIDFMSCIYDSAEDKLFCNMTKDYS